MDTLFGVWTIYLCHLAKSVKEVEIWSDPPPPVGTLAQICFLISLPLRSTYITTKNSTDAYTHSTDNINTVQM